MKRNKLILGAIILFVAFMFVQCNNPPPASGTSAMTTPAATAMTGDPTSFFYRIFKVGSSGSNSTALDSKNKVWVKINNGSFHQVFYGGENDMSVNISCPTSPDYVPYTLYFALVRTASPFDTMDRDYLYDTIRSCSSDLFNIPTTSDYYRYGTIRDSITKPGTNYQQIVIFPPTKGSDSTMRVTIATPVVSKSLMPTSKGDIKKVVNPVQTQKK